MKSIKSMSESPCRLYIVWGWGGGGEPFSSAILLFRAAVTSASSVSYTTRNAANHSRLGDLWGVGVFLVAVLFLLLCFFLFVGGGPGGFCCCRGGGGVVVEVACGC